MDLEQLLAEIAKHPLNNVLEGLKKTTIYQPIFNEGHKVATAQKADDLKAKDKEIEKVTKSLNDLQTEFQAFRDKNPSAAELQRQYTDAIATKDREIQQLKDEQAKEKKEWIRSQVLAKVQTKLSDVLVPEIAEAKAEKLRDRIQLPDGTTVQIMQAGQQIPFAGDLDAQIASLVEEVTKGVPEYLHRSGVVDGSGRDTAAAGAGGGKKDFFNKIRESVQKPAAQEGQPSTEDRLHGRLGLRTS